MYCCHLSHEDHYRSLKDRQNAKTYELVKLGQGVDCDECSGFRKPRTCDVFLRTLPVIYKSRQDAQILNSNSLALKGLHHLLNQSEGSQWFTSLAKMMRMGDMKRRDECWVTRIAAATQWWTSINGIGTNPEGVYRRCNVVARTGVS